MTTPQTEARKPASAESRARSPSPIRNVLSNWTVFLFGAVANFFVAPFVVQSLGDSAYGAWALLGSLVGYLGLLDLGVRGAVMRFVARLHAADDDAEASRFASAGFFVFAITSSVAVVGGIGLSFFIEDLFTIPESLVQPAKAAVVISALTIGTALINGVFGGVLTALQRFDLSSGLELAVEALRIAGVILFLRAGYGIVALAGIQLTCGLIRLLASYLISRRLYPALRLSWRGWSREHVGQLVRFSAASSALQGAMLIAFQLDAIVIGAFLPVSMITFFAIGATLTQYARSVVEAISHTITPRISAIESRGDEEEVRKLPLVAGRIATLILLPIAITFLVRGGTFIGLWMGADYGEPSGEVLRILSISLWFIAGRMMMSAALMGTNRHRLMVPVVILEAVANVGLSVALIDSMGIAGVAWGTTVPSVVVTVGALPFIYARALGTRATVIWGEVWLRPSLAMVPFAGASYLVQSLPAPESLLGFFGGVLLALPAAALGAWWFGLSGEERAALSPSRVV